MELGARAAACTAARTAGAAARTAGAAARFTEKPVLPSRKDDDD